ncbi:DALR anticodon-binding domain-containing protein, partial [Escherichia coli]|uniref:DALR anticodon-binding domain-containing protein n=1 Tax=Escherichia coli TaxID=562 RepID=UPI0032DA2030
PRLTQPVELVLADAFHAQAAALVQGVVVLRDKLEPYFAEGRYQDALVELAELREPVDAFFDKVMVMVDDKELRINRLTMLEKLRELFLRVADISLLQ